MHTLLLTPMRAVLLSIALAATLGAQNAASNKVIRARAGEASFVVPADWHLLSTTDSARFGQFVYHIRNPAFDSSSDDRANVIVNFRARSGSRSFKAGSDSLLGGLIESSMIVLHDTIVGRSQRAVFWRGQIKATPYIGYDDVAAVGSVWVHVRIVMPLSDKTPEAWAPRYSHDTEYLLRSMRVSGHAPFPVSIGYPALVPFGPGTANER